MIFDGLDELLEATRRAEVTTIVERFCTEYPLAPVLVTSGQVGYDQARLDDRQFSRYRLGGFTEDQAGEYVRKWFAQEDAFKTNQSVRWANAFMDESSTHRIFLEYFSAAYLAYGCDTPERLAAALVTHTARHEWEIFSELAVQIKYRTSDQEADRVYSACSAIATIVHRRAEAAYCNIWLGPSGPSSRLQHRA